MASLAAPPVADAPGGAVALRLLAAGCATGLAFCVHGASAHAGTAQIVLLRAALAIPPLLLWAALTAPPADWRPRAPRRHLVRGGLGALSMALNFYALGQLPVAHAQALSYLAPVLSIPAAVILLGERLSVRAVVAVAVGFAGMMAMLFTAMARPEWGWAEVTGMAAAVGSAGTMALVRVQVKSMTATETTISIALTFAVICTALGLAAVLLAGWTPMTPALWAWTLGAGVLGAATHVAATESVARASVSTLAPFDYAGLVFAVALDFALFAHLPGPWGWLGIALIAAAGLLSLRAGAPEATGLRLR